MPVANRTMEAPVSSTTAAISTDFLVIGSGIAGLTYAISVAEHGQTIILTKKNSAESNTNYAQGGIAGVMAGDDSPDLHADDTVIAGAGLCHDEAVSVLVHEGPDRIRDLMALGARFNFAPEEAGVPALALGREGGHSRNRIVHAVDRTGWECERALLAASRSLRQLSVLEHFFVLDLAMEETDSGLRCIGAYCLDTTQNRTVLFLARRAVLLATGGCGRIYSHTTNPSIATGDGVAMAWRAGAAVANMEFIQFHPTSLFHAHGDSFLISEAVRGEGGILRNGSGEAFMERYDPRRDLAPRDIVARAIHAERLARGEPCVFLDVTHIGGERISARFPTITRRCRELGIDPGTTPIPVVPAAHYMCGGVQTDLLGRTSVPGLLAAGEVSCTGVHGANRLASNSLLEAMVFGKRAATVSIGTAARQPESSQAMPSGTPWLLDGQTAPAPPDVLHGLRGHVRAVMHDYAGIVRTDANLSKAADRMDGFQTEVDEIARACRPSVEVGQTRNIVTVASLVVRSARRRTESRGLHYNTDHPDTDDVSQRHDTVLRRPAD